MIGLLPCAGSASRIYGLPKWMLPIPDGFLLDWHIKNMLSTDCSKVLVGARPSNYNLLNEYVVNAEVYIAKQYDTMSETLLSGYQYSSDDFSNNPCLFGMSDTYWLAPNVYRMLVELLNKGADVAVAAFWLREGQHKRMGCLSLNGDRIVDIIDKPDFWPHVHHPYGWGALAWTPKFWDYMQPDDPHVGYALPRAIAAGLDVRAHRILGGVYWDCGILEDYFELCSLFAKDKEAENVR